MTAHIPAIEKMADSKIRKWIEAKHTQERLLQDRVQEHLGPYLAISRECGAGGSEIARQVGQLLGWEVLDKEIIEYLAEHYGTPRSLVELVDEKKSNWLSEVLASWLEGLTFTSAAYTHRLHQLFMLAASHGNVIIVGRGARFILPADRGLSVRLVAPLKDRVRQIQSERGISEKEAHKFVVESDRHREAFVWEHFHRKVADPHHYDLVINVARFGVVSAAKMIEQASRDWLQHHQDLRIAS